MTKSERLALEAAQREVARLRALRLHDPVAPDIAVPTEGHTVGWSTSYRNVHRGWSERGSHGEGTYTPQTVGRVRIASREGVALHSTEARAWREVRARLAREYADALADLDATIARLEASTAEPSP